jgi:hypothetical protein
MSEHHSLLNVLKSLGYEESAIKSIMSAAESARIEKVEASRAALTELKTPLQAAAQSARHSAQLKHLDNRIFQASGGRYRLPKDTHVDLLEVHMHIKAAPILARAEIKSGLYALGLIPA